MSLGMASGPTSLKAFHAGPSPDLLRPPVPALPAPLEMQGTCFPSLGCRNAGVGRPRFKDFASMSLSFTIFKMGTNICEVHQM